jgi:hypothetical protein
MDATPPTSRSRWLLAIVASTAIVLLVAPVAARGPCPGEAPVPWTGPTLYSGGFHFAALGGVSPSIALFRRLNDLPDLQWPERIFFYPTSWLGDAWPVPSAPVQPSAEEKLQWAPRVRSAAMSRCSSPTGRPIRGAPRTSRCPRSSWTCRLRRGAARLVARPDRRIRREPSPAGGVSARQTDRAR